jgi:hypothetical protein
MSHMRADRCNGSLARSIPLIGASTSAKRSRISAGWARRSSNAGRQPKRLRLTANAAGVSRRPLCPCGMTRPTSPRRRKRTDLSQAVEHPAIASGRKIQPSRSNCSSSCLVFTDPNCAFSWYRKRSIASKGALDPRLMDGWIEWFVDLSDARRQRQHPADPRSTRSIGPVTGSDAAIDVLPSLPSEASGRSRDDVAARLAGYLRYRDGLRRRLQKEETVEPPGQPVGENLPLNRSEGQAHAHSTNHADR